MGSAPDRERSTLTEQNTSTTLVRCCGLLLSFHSQELQLARWSPHEKHY